VKSVNRIQIHADLGRVYEMAADVLEWPRLLSHYRWVRVVEGRAEDPDCVVEMAAQRDGFPCKWQARRTLFPATNRIHYLHTRSTWTRGMDVWWTVEALDGGLVEARITHEMPPSPNPLVEWFRRFVVGWLFVENIADKTLEGLKRHLERGQA